MKITLNSDNHFIVKLNKKEYYCLRDLQKFFNRYPNSFGRDITIENTFKEVIKLGFTLMGR